jgi:hypothetical protein
VKIVDQGYYMKEKRKKARRNSDRFLKEMRNFLKGICALIDNSSEKNHDYSEFYADMVGLREKIGRRESDKNCIDEICAYLEKIALYVENRLENSPVMLKRVRLYNVQKSQSLEGWQQVPPIVGKSYWIYQDGGKFFRTSKVIKVGEKSFQTKNSTYEFR